MIEKIINITANSVGWDKAKVEIDNLNQSLDLNKKQLDIQKNNLDKINKSLLDNSKATDAYTKQQKSLEDRLKTLDKSSKAYEKTQQQLSGVNETLVELTIEQEKLYTKKISTEKSVINSTKQITDQTEKLNDAKKKTPGLINTASTAAKGFGTALKGLGIGLIVAVLAALTNAFSKNQKVVDTFQTFLNAASIVVNTFIENVSKVVDEISKATNGFEGLSAVLGGTVKLAINNILLAFNGLKLGLLAAQLAWEKSFLGGNDLDKIKELQDNIDETKNKLAEVAQDSLEQGKKVINNFGKALNEFGQLATGIGNATVDTIKTIDGSLINQAKSITKLKNNYDMLGAAQQRLINQFQNERLELLELRDDTNKSFAERIEAAEKLFDIIEKQTAAEKEQIRLKIASLQQENELLGRTEERDLAIFNLQTELLEVDKKLSKQRIQNSKSINTLKTQELKLIEDSIAAENKREQNEIQFAIQRAQTEGEKIILKQQLLDLQKTELDNLDLEREKYEEGTAERLAADQAYLDAKQKFTQQEILLNDQIGESRRLALSGDLTDEEKLQFELEREIERLTALREAGVITDEEFDNLKLQREQELADEISRIQLEADRATQMAKVQNAQMYFGAVANLSKDLFEFSNNIGKKDEASQLERAKRQFKVNKAFELGQAGIGGARAVISALGAPFPLNLVQLPIAIATTAASIAKIASAQFDPGATGGDAAPTLETPNLSATPNPELFGTGVDTNETTLGGSTTLTQPREQLIKAVVVESDITETRDRLDLIESGAEL
jgi:hypothetical protein